MLWTGRYIFVLFKRKYEFFTHNRILFVQDAGWQPVGFLSFLRVFPAKPIHLISLTLSVYALRSPLSLSWYTDRKKAAVTLTACCCCRWFIFLTLFLGTHSQGLFHTPKGQTGSIRDVWPGESSLHTRVDRVRACVRALGNVLSLV